MFQGRQHTFAGDWGATRIRSFGYRPYASRPRPFFSGWQKYNRPGEWRKTNDFPNRRQKDKWKPFPAPYQRYVRHGVCAACAVLKYRNRRRYW